MAASGSDYGLRGTFARARSSVLVLALLGTALPAVRAAESGRLPQRRRPTGVAAARDGTTAYAVAGGTLFEATPPPSSKQAESVPPRVEPPEQQRRPETRGDRPAADRADNDMGNAAQLQAARIDPSGASLAAAASTRRHLSRAPPSRAF